MLVFIETMYNARLYFIIKNNNIFHILVHPFLLKSFQYNWFMFKKILNILFFFAIENLIFASNCPTSCKYKYVNDGTKSIYLHAYERAAMGPFADVSICGNFSKTVFW